MYQAAGWLSHRWRSASVFPSARVHSPLAVFSFKPSASKPLLSGVSCFSVRVTFPGCLKSSLDDSYNQRCNEYEWAPYRNFRTLCVWGAVAVELGRVFLPCFLPKIRPGISTDFLPCFLPKIRPGISTDDCALWAATTQAVRRSRPWSKPCLGPCFSAHPRPHLHTGHSSSGGPLPLPKHSGFPTGPPASPGSGSCGSVPTVHFPLGSPGNHQKARAPDANPALPNDKRCVCYWGWAGSRAVGVP